MNGIDPASDEGQRMRARLEAERERVLGLVGGLRDELGEEAAGSQGGELANYDQHPADAASDVFEREKELAILDRLEAELGELEAALARLDAGTYGVDESTGEPIDPERLDAFPTARFNVGSGPAQARPPGGAAPI